jgi:hypothetical protein
VLILSRFVAVDFVSVQCEVKRLRCHGSHCRHTDTFLVAIRLVHEQERNGPLHAHAEFSYALLPNLHTLMALLCTCSRHQHAAVTLIAPHTCFTCSQVSFVQFQTKTKLHGLSPRANYTDRETAACQRSDCQLLRIEGAKWSP